MKTTIFNDFTIYRKEDIQIVTNANIVTISLYTGKFLPIKLTSFTDSEHTVPGCSEVNACHNRYNYKINICGRVITVNRDELDKIITIEIQEESGYQRWTLADRHLRVESSGTVYTWVEEAMDWFVDPTI